MDDRIVKVMVWMIAILFCLMFWFQVYHWIERKLTRPVRQIEHNIEQMREAIERIPDVKMEVRNAEAE